MQCQIISTVAKLFSVKINLPVWRMEIGENTFGAEHLATNRARTP